MDIKDFLIKNSKLINITYLESELGMAEKTISKFLNGKRNLPKKWEEPIEEYLKEKFNGLT